MNKISEFIESGILEQYVLGAVTAQEASEVEQMAVTYPEVREEIEEISKALEQYALANAVTPDITIKPFLLATIDYTERLEKGEPQSFPPLLNESSKLTDFSPWLERSDMVLPADAED